MDLLRLKGLQFYGKHGTETWEKETGTRFLIDVELRRDLSRAARSDRLKDALDYRLVHDCARRVLEDESHDLLERLAGRVMDEMFATFPVEEVTVRVAKPEARIGGINQAVEIEMTRSRSQWEQDSGEQDSGKQTRDPK